MGQLLLADKNIALIGMPGTGKSTVGVILAKLLGYHFLDTDLLIQTEQGKTLQEIIDTSGHLALRKVEEDILLKISGNRQIIATGGSAIYSKQGIQHLQKSSILVFLETGLAALNERIFDYETRGIAKSPSQSFEDVFTERHPLYQQYADLTICNDKSAEETAQAIIDALKTVDTENG